MFEKLKELKQNLENIDKEFFDYDILVLRYSEEGRIEIQLWHELFLKIFNDYETIKNWGSNRNYDYLYVEQDDIQVFTLVDEKDETDDPQTDA